MSVSIPILKVMNKPEMASDGSSFLKNLEVDYKDETGYVCKSKMINLEVIIKLAILAVSTDFKYNSMRNYNFILLIKEILDLGIFSDKYFYNYIPCPSSYLPISLAYVFSWHKKWLNIPFTFFHFNEWNFLLYKGLNLTNYTGIRIRCFWSRKRFLYYLFYSHRYDESKETLSISRIRFQLEPAEISELSLLLEAIPQTGKNYELFRSILTNVSEIPFE